MYRRRVILMLMALVCVALWGNVALAEPLFGDTLQFQQLPLNGGLIPSVGGSSYAGENQLSTATTNGNIIFPTFTGTYMADDYAATAAATVYHVEWWGGYLNPGSNANGAQRFLVSFETDVAASGSVPSHPGTLIISQIVTKGALASGSGTFTETPEITAAGAAQSLFKYTAELTYPFLQQANQVVWLKIAALVDPETDGSMQWGWHTRDYTINNPLASATPVPGEHSQANGLGTTIWKFQDSATSGGLTAFQIPGSPIVALQQPSFAAQNYLNGSDGPNGINAFGKELAFRIYGTPTVAAPEPATLALLGIGSVALLWATRKRRMKNCR